MMIEMIIENSKKKAIYVQADRPIDPERKQFKH